jgi:hypothetical protein
MGGIIKMEPIKYPQLFVKVGFVPQDGGAFEPETKPGPALGPRMKKRRTKR